jgi:DNA primase
MIINGIQFDVELMDILTELKSQLAENGVERFYKMFDSGDDIMVCCPYHKDGQERRPSAGIRKSDGLLHCLACGTTVGLDEMIANCFGRTDPIWGFRWLIQNFAIVKVENRKEITYDISREHTPIEKHADFVPDEELDIYRYTHPYLYQRGLTDEIIERFDLGYDRKTDSITFPIRQWHDSDFGKTLFIARRSIKTKRFDLPKDMEKPLYGLYEILFDLQIRELADSRHHQAEEIYVCEGLFDMLRLWCNRKYAVAGFGCLYSDYQIKLLAEVPTRKLVLAFDADKAGRDGAERVRQKIKNKIITEVILPPGRKDIGECTDEEIRDLSEVF